jgi:hypothetical protein
MFANSHNIYNRLAASVYKYQYLHKVFTVFWDKNVINIFGHKKLPNIFGLLKNSSLYIKFKLLN